MTLLSRLKHMSNIFFQDGCIVCGKATNAIFCPECAKEVSYINQPICTRCGKPFTTEQGISHLCYDCIKEKNKFTMARAVFKYDGAIKKLIHRFKFGDQVHLSAFFSDQLLKLYNTHFATKSIHAIIPVPLAKHRLKHRSYNQTQLLAKTLSKELSLPIYSNALIKVRETAPQSKLNSAQRHENVKRAYKVAVNHQLKYRNILLVDDVVTTGATVNACTRVLMRAGAKHVYVIAIAMNV